MLGWTGVGDMSSAHAATPQLVVIERVLADLLAHDLVCAPRVAVRLVELLDGDAASIREVVRLLEAPERAGTRPLPCPLPAVPSITRRFAALRPAREVRMLLLAAALSLDDEFGPVLVAGRVDDAASVDVSEHLRVHAGRFRFIERRLAVWVRATSSRSAITETHRRLAAAHRNAGNSANAAWHSARGSTRDDLASSAELIRSARESAEAGHSDRALRFATEAAAHTRGADHDAARLIAGVSALGAAHMAEAAGWLAPVISDGAESTRLRGLAALLVAHTHLHGAVPEVDTSLVRPQGDDRDDWLSWSRAAAFGAALCAERGDRLGARRWIDALRDGAARAGAPRSLRDPVVALTWLLLGESEPGDVSGTGPVTGIVLGALQRAVSGDVDGGLRLLAAGETGVVVQDDPFIAGLEQSDLIAAHRVVAEVLLVLWRGDIADARRRLHEASLRLPITVPFAGIGVVLARRLDLAVLGRLGPFALALTAALPAPARVDQLVDRAIRAHLGGDSRTAASCLRLWLDRGAPQPALSVPGLDECVPVGVDAASIAPHRVEPPEMTLGRLLRLRAATSPDPLWRIEAEDAAEAARSITSPFERARVEACLGTRALIDGDAAVARTHLLVARNLFDESGATAWAQAVVARLDDIGDEDGCAQAAEALASTRRRWEGLLTPRELDVAMLAVQGGSNRDIAAALTVSVRTVEVHLGRVFTKLGVRSRVDLVLLGYRTARFA